MMIVLKNSKSSVFEHLLSPLTINTLSVKCGIEDDFEKKIVKA